MREAGQASKHDSWSQDRAELGVTRAVRLKTENSRSESGGSSGDPRTNVGEAMLRHFIFIS